MQKGNSLKGPHRAIAAAVVVDTSGDLLLQLRDDKPDIIYPGGIGLFGGHCEDNESALDCAVRELAEELTYDVAPERFVPLACREGEDTERKGGTFRGDFFLVRGIPRDKIVVTEGALLVVAPDDLDQIRSKLTPTASFALDAYVAMMQKSS
jgi:8-oxo-dGTP pyrophosphatase MutT (NUDIX family)